MLNGAKTFRNHTVNQYRRKDALQPLPTCRLLSAATSPRAFRAWQAAPQYWIASALRVVSSAPHIV